MLTRILLDIGHGGRDPGAVSVSEDGHQLREYDLARETAMDALPYLIAALSPENVGIIDAGNPDDGAPAYSIDDRAQEIVDRANEATLVMSLHLNKGDQSATGAEIFHYRSRPKAAANAKVLLEAYCAKMGMRNRGVKPDTQSNPGSLGIMTWAAKKDPKIIDNILLLELGFISNDPDVAAIRTNAGLSVAHAALKLMGVPFPPVDPAGPFPDVTNDHFAADAIRRMKKLGIANGYADGLFRPDKALSRAEAIVLFDRMLNLAAASSAPNKPLHYPRHKV